MGDQKKEAGLRERAQTAEKMRADESKWGGLVYKKGYTNPTIIACAHSPRNEMKDESVLLTLNLCKLAGVTFENNQRWLILDKRSCKASSVSWLVGWQRFKISLNQELCF